MTSSKNLFGPRTVEIWRQLSQQINARFIKGSFWESDKIIAKVDAWTVTLDTYTEPVGLAAVTYTRLRAPYVNQDGFRFLVYEKSFFSGINKRLGMQDIEVGDSVFDAKFILQGNDQAKVRALFTDVPLRDMMIHQAWLHMEVKEDEGWFGERLPERMDELYLQVVGGITNIDRLKAMYELFAETLHQLSRIGSASTDISP